MRQVVGWMLVLGLAFGIPPALAADAPMAVLLNFTGRYLGNTCRVEGASDMEVTMPKVSTQSLATVGAEAGSTMFTLLLRCDSGVSSVRVYFEGDATTVDRSTGNLKPTTDQTTAGNVQIRLSNPDGTQIKVGDRSSMKVVPVTSTNPIPVQFVASYFATAPTTAGRVSAYVTYVIEVP
ncbi:fimbrial protein [Burkholderia glumae]|uniref:Type 1 fimbrial protein n=1 Tax=Burkholderia glumae TaxID=337 RepID=A0AAQ0BRB4_BURGL|nr:fimbrial protein [Burkholderia glumae]ACR30627.1 P pilus assembly protein, pilin FimA [Burkholderia glumae BGR1]AJY64628.1 fimbrial family protein [Burkholderia glumae LMG 2196 = ATCC 33617]KHJ64970.1 pilus assembly protein FimA [Burkholderia glumae]MCM2484083.1 type 1 fimbrial protein [Burkholderia glumae]MCM2494424.1 type 1 fimbrial protein [Burkholderia glumae]